MPNYFKSMLIEFKNDYPKSAFFEFVYLGAGGGGRWEVLFVALIIVPKNIHPF